MERFVLVMGALMLGSDFLPAQESPGLTSFHPQELELRRLGDRWQLRAGTALVKDLGGSEADAREALRLLRELRLNQHGTIGTPEPVIEFWLCAGQAPPASGLRQGLTAIDLPTLQVTSIEGYWCVRDARQMLFNFGPHEADARRALAVLQQYRFNRVGMIGMPTPVLMYFLTGPEQELGKTSAPPHLPQPLTMHQVLFPRQLALPRPLLHDPETGGERLPIDWRQVQVRRQGQRVQLVHGHLRLADFGSNELDAREALRLVQFYRFTEQCRFGTSAQPVTFFLVNGRAPRGLGLGVQGRPFRPEALTLRHVEGRWLLCEGPQPLLPGGNSEAEARRLLESIKKYQFDHLCWVGRAEAPALTFLVQTR